MTADVEVAESHDEQPETDATADAEGSAATPEYTSLIGSLEELMETQRTVLRLLDFIVARAEELDDVRTRVLQRVRTEYPDIEEDIVTTFLNGMDTVLSEVREIEESEDREAAEDKVAESIKAVITRLPEGYQPIPFVFALSRAQVQEPSANVLLESLLVSLVGNFEMQIAMAARTLLNMFPGGLESSERVFTWKEVAQHESLDAFREVVFDRAIDDLMRESASGWFKWFETKHKVKIPAIASDLQFREVLQRRHVIVHNGSNVSRLYLENLPDLDPRPELGTHLGVDEDYLRRAADALLVAGVSLLANIGRKVLKTDQKGFQDYVCNIPYRMLQDGRYGAAHALTCEFEGAWFDAQYSQLTTQVNQWLALKRLGRFEECREEVVAWDTTVLGPEFRLARLALLDDLEAGHAIVKQIRGTSSLSLAFWFAWPLLAELREYERSLEVPPGNGK